MSDSDKAMGQSVEQKAADKVNGADCALLEPVVFTIFISKAYHAAFKGSEARVGDSHAVCIPGEVFKDVLRLFNWFTHTDDPFVFIESVFQLPVLPIKAEFTLAHSSCEVVDELAPKDH